MQICVTLERTSHSTGHNYLKTYAVLKNIITEYHLESVTDVGITISIYETSYQLNKIRNEMYLCYPRRDGGGPLNLSYGAFFQLGQ